MESTSLFLQKYQHALAEIFNGSDYAEGMGTERGIPGKFLQDLWKANPMSAFIPTSHGGRGGHIHESLGVLEACAYHSLPLSLMFGINCALFLQPIAKFGSSAVKANVFNNFLNKPTLGGLMITEPSYGTDALNMQTSYLARSVDANAVNAHGAHGAQSDSDSSLPAEYHLSGVKHWAGMTGQADYWLIAARERTGEGKLLRDISLFVCDQHEREQHIHVDEQFKALGLYLIGYGRNLVDAVVPDVNKLIPEHSGVRMLMSVLRRSRLQFGGMAMGFLKRLSDEALNHSQTRFVGKKALFSYDQVQARVGRIQAMTTVCAAMCMYASKQAGLAANINEQEVSANVLKAVVTDYMQEASQSLLQLVGAGGYKLTHIAGRSVIDSRPFQIFEGSNDVLYQQICNFVLGKARKAKATSLGAYLASSEWQRGIAALGKSLFDFRIDETLSQRKQVALGQFLGRAISADWLVSLADAGYRADLIEAALAGLREELVSLRSSVTNSHIVPVSQDFSDKRTWLEVLQPAPELV
jgi:alkylation response protein AidB-like acyl-CoA dehydrogenase